MTTRACGRRIAGGIYMECAMSPYGEPLEYFLYDPPIPVSATDIGLSSVGVKPFTTGDDVTHVLDWVGRQYYPTPKEFLEEVRQMGLSRRIPRNFPFERLTRASRVVLVHPLGYHDRFASLYPVDEPWYCPTNDHPGPEPPDHEMCCGLWWDQLYGSAKNGYQAAFIAAFPITNLAVIRSDDAAHQQAWDAARASELDVTVEEA